MDTIKLINELRQERYNIDQAIAVLASDLQKLYAALGAERTCSVEMLCDLMTKGIAGYRAERDTARSVAEDLLALTQAAVETLANPRIGGTLEAVANMRAAIERAKANGIVIKKEGADERTG